MNIHYFNALSDKEKLLIFEEIKIFLVDKIGYSRSFAQTSVRQEFKFTIGLSNELFKSKELKKYLDEHFPLKPKNQKGRSIVGMIIKRIEDENRN